MTDQPPHDLAEDLYDGEDLTAAEYALGVLNHEERAAAEARSERDPAFAREILAWVIRFAPLIDRITPVEPSPGLWARIEEALERLKPQVAAISEPASATPIRDARTPANDAAPRGLMLWRAWAIGASAIAAAAILVVTLHMATPVGGAPGPSLLARVGGPAPTLVATLGLTQGGAAAVTVAYDPNQSTIYAAPDADFSIPRARSAELWLIPSDGKPRPMGVIDPAKPATMPMPPEFKTLARAKVTLAISIEPPGGSPTGLPTGPVVATGKFAQI
jgi:anti-sigma-K factor RskA